MFYAQINPLSYGSPLNLHIKLANLFYAHLPQSLILYCLGELKWT